MSNFTSMTMVARFASKCKRCGGSIPVGSKFRYVRGPGWTKGIGYHLSVECPASEYFTGTKQEAPIAEPVAE